MYNYRKQGTAKRGDEKQMKFGAVCAYELAGLDRHAKNEYDQRATNIVLRMLYPVSFCLRLFLLQL
jgi:hypothetical protein